MKDMTTVKTPRRNPYVRSAGRTFLHITDRDRAIFGALFEFRYLTFEQLSHLIPHHPDTKSDRGHEKKLRERLTELFHSGYVDRTRTQQYPSVYSLASEAAPHLTMTDADAERIDWLKRNRTNTWHFIEHTIEVAEFRIDLARKFSTHHAVDLVSGRTLINSIKAAVKSPPTQHPLLLRQPITLDIYDPKAGRPVNKTDVAGTVPDHFFLLDIGGGKQRAFPVEIDRGSMPVSHRGFSGSSIERKLHVYAAAANSRNAADRWGVDTFRVLFVTDSPARSENIRKLARDLDTDIVWTAERETIKREAALSEYWLDPHGRAHALLPKKLVR